MSTTCKIYLEDSNPLYRGGDILSGYLEVSTVSNKCHKVAVSFEGHTRTWLSFDSLKEHVHVVPTAEYRFLKESQLFKFGSSYLQFSQGKLTYHFPFEFTIPQQLISSRSDIPTEFLHLPPTLKEGSILQKNGSTYMQPLIGYMLKATIYGPQPASAKDAPIICTEESEVVVEPSVEPSPLLDLKDSSSSTGEYTMSITKPIKRHPWSRPIGELSIKTEEPQPLDITTSAPRASTSLPLTLSFHPYHGIIPPNKPDPPSWTIDVTTSIRADTFFSTHKFTSTPTVASANRDLYTGLHSVSTDPETREFISPEWRTWRECVCLDSSRATTPDNDEHSNPCWTTTLNVPITAPKSLQPGYLSVLSAKKYSLLVQVKVKNSGHDEMELEIPLQVVNDSIGGGDVQGVRTIDWAGMVGNGELEIIPSFEESTRLSGGDDKEMFFTRTRFVASTVF